MKTILKKRFILNKNYILKLNELLSISTHQVSAIFASDCARHLMDHLAKDYEINPEALDAIEACHSWVSHEISKVAARVYAQKVHVLAREETNPVLKYFYRACGHAAATPHVKSHAIHATNYVLKALLSIPGIKSDEVEEIERSWQIKHLLDLGLKA
ncbi:MAG: hypothetical protein Q7I99_09895 [Acholeplasmataceae bacterium]|nr:hypothetical protein [Acholeplasmataceae bacterium]